MESRCLYLSGSYYCLVHNVRSGLPEYIVSSTCFCESFKIYEAIFMCTNFILSRREAIFQELPQLFVVIKLRVTFQLILYRLFTVKQFPLYFRQLIISQCRLSYITLFALLSPTKTKFDINFLTLHSTKLINNI